MGRIAILGMVILAMAGCSDRIQIGGPKKPYFEGHQFSGGAKAARDDRQNFTATARPVSKSLKGAVQAAEWEAIRHCIEFFGTSDIDWTRGPDSETQDLLIDKDTVVLSGSCRDV